MLSLVAGSLKIINPVLLYIYECKAACAEEGKLHCSNQDEKSDQVKLDKSSLAEHVPQSISRFLGDFLSVSRHQKPAQLDNDSDLG